jgi:DNA-binding NarL/FixJ family response regulator
VLTPRQRQVGELVARGLSAKAIAREIGLSVRTVEDHIQEAANRLPGGTPARHKLTIWFLNIRDDDEAA